MAIDYDIPRKQSVADRYDFSELRDGASIWVATNAERVALMRAFGKWKVETRSRLSAASGAVGPGDPRGAGFRIWFKAETVELRPVILAKLPKMESLSEIQRVRLRHSGIENDEDIIAAVLSTGITPTTATEANEIVKLLYAWKTPWQIERMAGLGRKTQEEIDAEYDAREAERERQMAKYRVTPEMRAGSEDAE